MVWNYLPGHTLSLFFQNLQGEALCICSAGRGDICNGSTSCSSSPCLNGGECITADDSNRFDCICLPGFTGQLCQEQVVTPPSPSSSNGMHLYTYIHMYIHKRINDIRMNICIYLYYECTYLSLKLVTLKTGNKEQLHLISSFTINYKHVHALMIM